MTVDGPADLRLAALTKRYGSVSAVDALTLTVGQGSYFALLGPSGCGKTTTLRLVAGLEQPSAGQVLLGGRDITRLRPYRRPVNTVFQGYALFPHLDVHENIAFGLRRRGVRDHRSQVQQMLSLVGLDGYGPRRPGQLSGGEQQRVALARALVNRPRVLLLDEPLGALDLKLRRQLQAELKRISTEVGSTFLHVTHDQDEALRLADTVAVLNAGRVEQSGAPAELYEVPATPFVADFLGRCNLIAGEVGGRTGADVLVQAYGCRLSVPASRSRATGRPVYLGVRPERLRLLGTADQVPTAAQSVAGVVTDTSYQGAGIEYLVRTGWGIELSVYAPNTGAVTALPPGTAVLVCWQPAHAFLLDRAPGAGTRSAPPADRSRPREALA